MWSYSWHSSSRGTFGNFFSTSYKLGFLFFIIFFMATSSLGDILTARSSSSFSSISCMRRARQAFFSKFLERTFQFLARNSLQSLSEMSSRSSFMSCMYFMQNSGLASIFSMILMRLSPAKANFLSIERVTPRLCGTVVRFGPERHPLAIFSYRRVANYYSFIIMNSYLESIKLLQNVYDNPEFIPKVQQYGTYEDYLHQRNTTHEKRYKPTTSKIVKDQKRVTWLDQPVQGEPSNMSNVTYFPFQRKEIEYKTQAKIEKVPVIKKKVEYVEKKQVEIVPKEISVTDYYAVEHIRQYIKEVVPEVKIQKVTKPVTVKKYQTIPIEKQIIFYPDNIQDLEEAKAKARENLIQRGVEIQENAQYRPISQKDEVHSTFLKEKREDTLNQSLSPIEANISAESTAQFETKKTDIINEVVSSSLNEKPYYQLARPAFKSRTKAGQSPVKVRKTDISVPIYQKQKYNLGCFQPSTSSSLNRKDSLPNFFDYSFSDRGQYRYDLAMYNSSKRLNR